MGIAMNFARNLRKLLGVVLTLPPRRSFVDLT
jgi:hypothetical protein